MEPGRLDFKFRRGTTFKMYLRVQDYIYDPLTNEYTLAGYMNLTGAVFSGQFRERSSDPEPIASMSFVIDDQTDPDRKGGVTVKIDYLDTEKFALGDYQYDILVELNGEKYAYLEGVATCRGGVTR